MWRWTEIFARAPLPVAFDAATFAKPCCSHRGARLTDLRGVLFAANVRRRERPGSNGARGASCTVRYWNSGRSFSFTRWSPRSFPARRRRFSCPSPFDSLFHRPRDEIGARGGGDFDGPIGGAAGYSEGMNRWKRIGNEPWITPSDLAAQWKVSPTQIRRVLREMYGPLEGQGRGTRWCLLPEEVRAVTAVGRARGWS